MLTRDSVPASLAILAGWCWRILLVVATVLGLLLLVEQLYLPALPLFFALLLAALLHPLLEVMRRIGLPRALATWATILIALLVLGGVGWFVWQRAASTYPRLLAQADSVSTELLNALNKIPGADTIQLAELQNNAITWLKEHTSLLASGVVSFGTVLGQLVTGLIVLLFVTFYFLQEGDRIWSWVVRLFPKNVQPSVRGAGYRSWRVLSGWVVGTAIIALFHGVVVGLFLFLLGVPLAVPLAVLVFVGSFIPIIGSLVFGGLAVLVTLLTQGVGPAVALVVLLLVDSQIEAHVLQPFIVGKAVKLHPVAIVLALTAGGLVGGIFGALMSIPIVACAHAAVKYLTGVEDLDGNPRGDGPADRMSPEPPLEYAPLPLFATTSSSSSSSPSNLDGHPQPGVGATGADQPQGAHVAHGAHSADSATGADGAAADDLALRAEPEDAEPEDAAPEPGSHRAGQRGDARSERPC